jgi:hypothetical protein
MKLFNIPVHVPKKKEKKIDCENVVLLAIGNLVRKNFFDAGCMISCFHRWHFLIVVPGGREETHMSLFFFCSVARWFSHLMLHLDCFDCFWPI